MTHRHTGAVAAGTGRHDGTQNQGGRTLAQWYAYLVGATLLLIGLLGFTADGSFDTGGSSDGEATGNADGMLQGDGFLGFEVNGWHNLVHIASGLFLLAMAGKRRTAKPAVITFGVLYGLVTLIGLIDGNDILGFMPVNPADNILHLALSALALYTGLTSRSDDPHRRDDDVDSPRRRESGRFDRTTTNTTTAPNQEVTHR